MSPSHHPRHGDLNLSGIDAGLNNDHVDHHDLNVKGNYGNRGAVGIGTSMATSDSMDDLERTFETALQHTRSSFLEMVSAKDHTILDLRTELARRDAHIQEQLLRISSLEHDLASAEKRNADLATVIRKMYSVRQQMDSFVDDEPLVAEILRKPSGASVSGGYGHGGADSSELEHSHQQHTSLMYRHQQQQQPQPSSSRFSAHPVPRSPRSPTSVSRAAYRTSRSPSPAGSARARATAQRRPISETGAPITTGFEPKDHLPAAASSRPRVERNEYHPYPTTTTASSSRLPTSNTTTPLHPAYTTNNSTTHDAPSTPLPTAHQGTSVDGRDFFRQARRTLSYDEFTALLTNVKAFNARQQSRQVTLDRVVQVLGGRYHEIERAFVGLMMHGTTSGAAASVDANRNEVSGEEGVGRGNETVGTNGNLRGKQLGQQGMRSHGMLKEQQQQQHTPGTMLAGV